MTATVRTFTTTNPPYITRHRVEVGLGGYTPPWSVHATRAAAERHAARLNSHLPNRPTVGNPVCSACGAVVTEWHDADQCGCDGTGAVYPCGHPARLNPEDRP